MFRSWLPRAATRYGEDLVRLHQHQVRSRTPLHRRRLATGSNREPALNRRSESRILTLMDRWTERLPRRLRGPLLALRSYPASYLVSFKILHELTAVVSLLGFVALFHYSQWLPVSIVEGSYINASVEKIGRWFRKRGWISEVAEKEVEDQVKEGNLEQMNQEWDSKSPNRFLVEFATAYAVVKVLMPARLLLSAFWAPGFARLVCVPVAEYGSAVWIAVRSRWRAPR
jgi:hypothetical protein